MKKIIGLALLSLASCISPTEPEEIKVFPPPQEMQSDSDSPMASFTVICGVDRVCVLDASSSHMTELPIAWYGWSFGDGSVLVTDKAAVAHEYKQKGIYTAMLTVWDTKNRGGRLYKQFEVK
jgi:hypothetical protein